MIFAIRGFILGLIFGALVYLAERTTGQIAWGLVLSFPLCFGIAGYLFWRWDIGGLHSQHNKKRTMKIVRAVERERIERGGYQ